MRYILMIIYRLYNESNMTHQITLPSGVILESVAKTLIINEKNEALVLTIGEYKEHPEKSYTPDLPGGFAEIGDGETERQGAIREAEEEAGVVINPKDIILAYSKTKFYEEQNKSVSSSLYIAHLDYTPDVVVSWEHASSEWIDVDMLLETKTFRPFYTEAIEYSIAHKLV